MWAIVDICILTAPFTPFLSEVMFQNLKGAIAEAPDSIHFILVPDFDPNLLNPQIEA